MFDSTALHSWTKIHLARKDISVTFFFLIFDVFIFIFSCCMKDMLMSFSCVLLFSDVWPMNTTVVGEGKG